MALSMTGFRRSDMFEHVHRECVETIDNDGEYPSLEETVGEPLMTRVIMTCPILTAIIVILVFQAVTGCSKSASSLVAENTQANCTDELDNDGDGYVDCEDQNCQIFVFCVETNADSSNGSDGDADADGDADSAENTPTKDTGHVPTDTGPKDTGNGELPDTGTGSDQSPQDTETNVDTGSAGDSDTASDRDTGVDTGSAGDSDTASDRDTWTDTDVDTGGDMGSAGDSDTAPDRDTWTDTDIETGVDTARDTAVEPGTDTQPDTDTATVTDETSDTDSPAEEDGGTPRDTEASTEPVLHYTFDGHANNSGTLVGYNASASDDPANYADGIFGDAINRSTSVSNFGEVVGSTHAVTIGLWFMETRLNDFAFLFDFRRFSDPDVGIQVYHGATASSHLNSCWEEPSGEAACSGVTMSYDNPTNYWHHLLIRWDGEHLDYYIDGQLSWHQTPPGNPFGVDAGQLLMLNEGGFYMDDLRVYLSVFDEPGQCEIVIEGEWVNDSCVLPAL